ncbi:MAG: PilZ domain-containing protein [Candidatus Methylomirabilales bacterium]|nr:PilZ domain-containing protein [candidate division NC10 bacterium]MCZ6550873.1 PilZ domain-containing protein [candidate division NC10 bacterium]
MTERRQYPRFSLRMPVICESPAVSGYHTLGFTQNVSQGGLLLEVPEVLAPGTSTGLRLLGGERITRADAVVVWMTQHSPGRIGLQFTGMVGADRLA